MSVPNAYNYGNPLAQPPNASEYNPNGDQQNGVTGSQTPASMFNAATTPRGSAPSPFERMLQHASALNRTISAPNKTRASGAGFSQPTFSASSNASFYGGGASDPGGYGGGGNSTPGIFNPGNGATPVSGQPVYDPATGNWSMPYSGGGNSSQTAGRSRASSPTLGAVDVSRSGLDPQYQSILQRWLQGNPAYGWLADPKYSWLVPQYFDEMQSTGNTTADFTDWLHSRVQSIVGFDSTQNTNPGYQRSGYDTYLGHQGNWQNDPNFTTDVGQTWTPSGGTGGGLLTYTVNPGGVLNPPPQQSGGGFTPDLQKQIDDYIAQRLSQQTQPGGNPTGGPNLPKPPDLSKPVTSPWSYPDWYTGQGGPNGAIAGNGSGPNGGAPTPNPTPLGTQGSYINEYSSMFRPLFDQQQTNLANQLDAQAAATGDINSGGYGANKAIAQSNLANEQSGKLADLAATSYENAQSRSLQKYGIDVQARLEQSGQELQKYGIDVNQVMQQYGIDTNDKLQRFLAELDSQTKIKVAQMGDSAASRSAAAQLAAAKVAAESANYRAGLDYNLGLGSLDLQNQGQIMNYILGAQGQNNNWINTLIGLINGVPPGGIVVKP